MERVLVWLRRFGTSGAVANARLLSEQLEREQRIVDALLLRLSPTDSRASAA